MPTRFHALAKFANLLATAPSSGEVKELLVSTAIDLVGAGAAVLVQLDERGNAHVAAQSGYGDDVPTFPHDAMGDEIAKRLLEASRGRFASSSALPLVALGGLYGVLVLLFSERRELSDDQLQLAGTIVDIAAATLARAQEVDELARANDELTSSRRALAQAEKLRALGGMAAGISHDLKNVFGPLLMVLDVLKKSKDDADTLRSRIEMMRRPLENGLAIVDRLRVFSKRTGEDEREGARVDAIVDDAVDLCRPRIDPTSPVTVVVERSEAPLVRVAVADAVASVTNLIVNALDALKAGGGVVTVTSGPKDGGAFIEVKDNGPGVPAALRDKIFEQFFTTKGKSGTGLGLALVKDFAQHHGGKLTLDSPPDGGARFTLWLPRSM